MIHFDRVSSGDYLLQWWPRIREGLVANVEFHGEITAPERVFQSVQAGTAELFLIFDDEDYVGFAVTTVEGVGIRHDPYFYLWQVYAPRLFEGERFAQYMAELDRLASERGLTRIRMNSTRKGWERAIRHYAEPVLVEYERKVPHGSHTDTPAA